MTDMDAFELRAELDASYQSLERLADQLVAAVEADSETWTWAMCAAVKETSSRIKRFRRRLKLEVAA